MNQLSMFELSGFGGLLILALDLWAIISVFGSTASTGKKVLWTLLIIFLPIIGFILWFFMGPRAAQRSI
ncbi:MAG: PLD nuclease N-terminal domain-containing protein [Paracoccaceae bacterium]